MDRLADSVFLWPTTADSADQQQPKKKRSKKTTAATGPTPTARSLAFLPLLDAAEHPVLTRTRMDLFLLHKHLLDSIVSETLASSNQATFASLSSFIQNASQSKIDPTDVPTTVIMTGVNFHDHQSSMTRLVDVLTHDGNHVVELRSDKCTAWKTTVKSLVEGFMEKDSVGDMEKLTTWFKKQESNNNENKGKLVVILSDFECFSPDIVRNLVQLLSMYQDSLPLVLLCGVATSIQSSMNAMLPSEVYSLLRIQCFHLQDPLHDFDLLVKKLFLESNCPLRLTDRLYGYLYETFINLNMSLAAFSSSLHFLLVTYFFAQPMSIMEDPKWKTLVQYMDNNHAEWVRQEPSFQRYVETMAKTDKKKARLLLTDDVYLFRELESIQNEMKQHQMVFRLAFRCLYLVVSQFETASMRLRLAELYDEVMQPNFFETDFFLKTIKLVRFFNVPKMVAVLTQIREMIANHADDVESLQTWYNTVDGILDKLTQSGKEKPSEEESDDENEENETQLVDSVLLHHIQVFLGRFFAQHLQHYTTLPLHEFFFQSAMSKVKKALHGEPRASMQTALGLSSHFLGCRCCPLQFGTIQPSMSDTSIVYGLYLEAGRMMNLFDWFQSFKTVVQEENGTQKPRKKAKTKVSENTDEGEYYSRFIKAVAEMRHLGFIKPTGRKTDHVVRLTFGMR